jgi:hypothetical protein
MLNSMTHDAAAERLSSSVEPPPPISARRAYTEVLLVFVLFFAASIISAGETLTGRVPAPSGSWGAFTPAAVEEVTDAAIAALVVILLSARRGLTPRLLGARLPRGADGKTSPGPAIRMAALGLVALLAGGVITSLVATGHLPQQIHPTGPYLLYAVAGSLFSGVTEEMIALAFVVSTLRQARRPVPEILIVAVLVRCSYHIYYGVGVIGIAVWAAVFVLLYLRFGSVIPLIILHFFWDAVQFTGQKWHVVGGIGVLVGLALLVTGLVCWLMDISNRRAAKYIRPPGNPYYQHQPPPSYPQQPGYPQQPPPGYPQQPPPSYPYQHPHPSAPADSPPDAPTDTPPRTPPHGG